MMRVQKKIPEETSYKTVWFNAWEYELLDPILSLFYKISSEYPEARTKKLKRILRKIGPIMLQNAPAVMGLVGILYGLPPVLGGIKFDKIVEGFDSPSNIFVPTITAEIEKMLQNGKLVIFIDELDRCKVENILGIIEAVKVFLQSPGVITVIGVDISILERAWKLRYGENPVGAQGRDYLDKIFQLRLSLPEKNPFEMKDYLGKMIPIFQSEEYQLLFSGFPHNPRKIKKLLNTLYFLSTNLKQETFDDRLPLVVIWSICKLEYPILASITETNANIFVFLTYFAGLLKTHTKLDDLIGRIKSVNKEDTINFDENHYILTEIFRNFEGRNLFLKGIEHINENSDAFFFLRMVSEGYFFNRSKEPPNYRAESSPFKKTNLIGYAPTAFEAWSNRELEESEKNLITYS